jgi:hypothetical protein
MDADQDAKKKDAGSNPWALHRSASDPIIAVFPVPAGPVTHLIFLGPPIVRSHARSSHTSHLEQRPAFLDGTLGHRIALQSHVWLQLQSETQALQTMVELAAT